MTGTTYKTMVNGVKFEFWSDFAMKATFAKNLETGEIKEIHGSGYIHKDLTARKAISQAFHLPTFRK